MNTNQTEEIPTQTFHEERRAASLNAYRRVPVLAHDRAESAAALGDYAVKLNRGERKKMHFCRSFLLRPRESVEVKPFPVKFALRLTGLKLTQLVRQQKKFARLASSAKYVAAKLSPGPSKIRSAVEGQQEECLARFKQVTAEIQARALACEGRLAEAAL